ncbi:MAG: DUF218 domain-containing protein [Monoraphidium minutum]|nr:MAG: DUF218 domain-containing protein [Monoraphidium minutum]
MAAGRRQPAPLLAAAAAAAVLAVALHYAGRRGLSAWLHGLLSDRGAHAPPGGGGAADVAVVLGYALHANGSCTRPLQSRVEVAVDLYRRGRVRHLIFSGAHPGGGLRNTSEADAMEAYAVALLGAPPPPGRWLREAASTSTRTNALFSLELIRQQGGGGSSGGGGGGGAASEAAAAAEAEGGGSSGGGGGAWHSIVLVTNPFHQARSYRVFRRAMADADMGGAGALYVAAAPFAGHAGYWPPALDAAADQLDFWRELTALAYYWARGWL